MKIDQRFKPSDVVWVIMKQGIKHYMVWSSTIEGIQFTQDGFQYILKTGGPTKPENVFVTYEEAFNEAHHRWAMEKESSLLVAPENAGVIDARKFGLI